MSPTDGSAAWDDASMHQIGHIDDFPIGMVIEVTIEDSIIGVVRTLQGIYAFGSLCPHQGAPMCAGVVTGTMLASQRNQYIYGLDGLILQCPWHGYEFHLDSGRSVGAVVRGRLPVYETQLRGQEIYVQLTRLRVGSDRPATSADA